MQTKTPVLARVALGAAILAGGVATGMAKGPSLIDEGAWKLIRLRGKEVTQFEVGKNRELKVEAKGAVGFYYTKLADIADDKVTLQWRWRVDRQIPPTDQARKGGDDRAIAVHLWFDDDESGSLFGKLGGLLGYPRVGHLMTYVWGGVRDANTVMANPYYDKGAIIIVRNGKARGKGDWQLERRDVVADYARAFGRTPDLSKLRYLAISADTDDTGTVSRARVADVVLRGK